MSLKFKCPHCGSKKLIEVTSTETFTEVTEITETGFVFGGGQIESIRHIERYECGGCSKELFADGNVMGFVGSHADILEWLEYQKEDRKKSCVGTSVTSFDGTCSHAPMFYDVSDFACIEEESIEISRDEFLKVVSLRDEMLDKPDLEFLYHEDTEIHMIYNIKAGVHYFFV